MSVFDIHCIAFVDDKVMYNCRIQSISYDVIIPLHVTPLLIKHSYPTKLKLTSTQLPAFNGKCYKEMHNVTMS